MAEFADNSQTEPDENPKTDRRTIQRKRVEADLCEQLGPHEAAEFMPIFDMCRERSKSYESSSSTKEARKKLNKLDGVLGKAMRLLNDLGETEMQLLETAAGGLGSGQVHEERKALLSALLRFENRTSRGAKAKAPLRGDWEATHLLLLHLAEAWERVHQKSPPRWEPKGSLDGFFHLADLCVQAATGSRLTVHQYRKVSQAQPRERGLKTDPIHGGDAA